MKTKLTLSCALVFCGTWLVAVSGYGQTIQLVPSASTIHVGDNFSVNVSAKFLGVGDLTGFGFDVDPLNALTHVSFLGYTLGSDYADLSLGNHLMGAYSSTGNADAEVLLATLNFSAVSLGTDTLLTQGVYDGLFSGLYYERANGDLDASLRLTVSSSGSTIPDSGSNLLLLGSGFVGLLLLRYKGLLRSA